MTGDSNQRNNNPQAPPTNSALSSDDLLSKGPGEGDHLLDASGYLLEMGDGFCRMLGYSREELKGRHLSSWDLNVPPPGDKGTPPFSSLLAGEHRETVYRCRDGSLLPVDVTLFPLGGASVRFFALARDLSDQKKKEQRLEKLLRFNRLRTAFILSVKNSVDESFLLESLCNLCVLHGPFVLAWVGRPEDHVPLQPLAASGDTRLLKGTPEGMTGPMIRHCFQEAWKNNRAYYDAFSAVSPGVSSPTDIEDANLVLSNAAVPVHRGESLWAVLCLHSQETHYFDDQTKPMIEELSLMLSNELERINTDRREISSILPQHSLPANPMDLKNQPDILFENISAGLLILDSNRTVREVNATLCKMTGYAREELVGQSEQILFENREAFQEFAPRFEEALQGQMIRSEFRFRRKNGSLLWTEVSGSGILLPEGSRGVVLSAVDTASLHEARQKLLHDPLTGLPNRLALEQALSGAIARARRNGHSFAVGMFDLDDFKTVNDNLGHDAGNILLRELAQRLKSQLRECDFLCRIGGDEFVSVIENLDIGRSTHQLTQVLGRLHQSVEVPFKLLPEQDAWIGMSMGLALFPTDGEDGDTLLRKADAAMYQAKMSKQERTGWWKLGPPLSNPVQEGPFDAYNADTKDLLIRHSHHIETVVLQFVESFFAQISEDPDQQTILSSLDEQEVQNIASFQARHLRFLLNPETTKELIHDRSRKVGRVHALAGVNGALLTQSMGLYRRLLSEHLNQTFLTARDRYRILLANEVRLQDDLQGELKSGIDTTGDYFALLSRPLPRQGALWIDVRTREVEALGLLPGIQCVFLMRLDSNGVFVVEESSGPRGPEGASIMRDPKFEAVIDPDSPRGQGLIAHAWRSLMIQRTPSYARDSRVPHWRAVVAPLNIRSAVSIPVRNLDGNAVAVVSLYGAFPNQFESPWMQQFAMGLGQRWEKIWELCRTPFAVLREDQAMDYRKELFSGGLAMHMQPVVDLATGRPVKLESLARLKRPGGEIVSPGLFLPILGDAELDRLFRLGLDMTLEWLSRWDEEGFLIDMSLNLPPGTLRDPDCPKWVEEALTRHKVAPHRLTLELLENREIDHQSQDSAINRLLALGVKLAMDDLGSGYSSLQRLSSLPFDNIKVDQGLLKRIRVAPLQTLSMIGTIVRMGHDFEQGVVVEGLEDAGMVEAAAILGAPFGQGYALARPMPPEQILEWNRNFRLPILPGTIKTFLGALSHHWTSMHSNHPPDSPDNFQNCPLTRFFEERGQHESEGAKYHNMLHQKKNSEAARRKLTNWLVEQVCQERFDKGPGSSDQTS